MARSDAQPPGHLIAADSPHHDRIPHDDQHVGRARHADVKPLSGATTFACLVHAQDDGRSLEALAAQDVAVEGVLAVPEAPASSRYLPVPLGLRLLLGVAMAGGEEGDVARVPPLLEQLLD